MISDELLKVDKSALVTLILQQDEQLTKLRAEVSVLHATVQKLQAQLYPPKRKSKDKTGQIKRSKPPHQWGQKKGHKGSWRPIPEQIDKEIDLRLTTCPNCRNPLGQSKHYDEHIQEDIIPSRVEVTRYRHWEYWCGTCQVHMRAPHAIEQIPYGHLVLLCHKIPGLAEYYRRER